MKKSLKTKYTKYIENTTKVFFQHYNIQLHGNKQVKETVQALHWNKLNHPLCSPDLAPSDWNLFHFIQNTNPRYQFSSFAKINNHFVDWIDSKQLNSFQELFYTFSNVHFLQYVTFIMTNLSHLFYPDNRSSGNLNLTT